MNPGINYSHFCGRDPVPTCKPRVRQNVLVSKMVRKFKQSYSCIYQYISFSEKSGSLGNVLLHLTGFQLGNCSVPNISNIEIERDVLTWPLGGLL